MSVPTGWLRAELLLELPAGAVLKAEYGTTSDQRVADRLRAIATNPATTAASKQQSIWRELDPPPVDAFSVSGPVEPRIPIAIPLFARPGRWLWMKLTIVTPPGVAPATLRELRVVYPDLSLMEQLPAVFRGPTGDASGVLRRLVGAIESTTHGIDEKIRLIGANVDPATAPDEWLDFLGQWLDLPWDDALPVRAKRCILASAGPLLEYRGTRTGIAVLARCLIDSAQVAVTDLTVDFAPIRLGGSTCRGGALPALLAGVSRRRATLGGQAVLGTARLGCAGADCDALASIAPAVRVTVMTGQVTVEARALFVAIVEQYLPVGVRLSVGWRLRDGLSHPVDDDDDVVVLDALGAGALNSDSRIGRTVLVGTERRAIGEAGLDLGFHL
jgi:phage tail-like protein